jgi:hypothetical protein
MRAKSRTSGTRVLLEFEARAMDPSEPFDPFDPPPPEAELPPGVRLEGTLLDPEGSAAGAPTAPLFTVWDGGEPAPNELPDDPVEPPAPADGVDPPLLPGGVAADVDGAPSLLKSVATSLRASW